MYCFIRIASPHPIMLNLSDNKYRFHKLMENSWSLSIFIFGFCRSPGLPLWADGKPHLLSCSLHSLGLWTLVMKKIAREYPSSGDSQSWTMQSGVWLCTRKKQKKMKWVKLKMRNALAKIKKSEHFKSLSAPDSWLDLPQMQALGNSLVRLVK